MTGHSADVLAGLEANPSSSSHLLPFSQLVAMNFSYHSDTPVWGRVSPPSERRRADPQWTGASPSPGSPALPGYEPCPWRYTRSLPVGEGRKRNRRESRCRRKRCERKWKKKPGCVILTPLFVSSEDVVWRIVPFSGPSWQIFCPSGHLGPSSPGKPGTRHFRICVQEINGGKSEAMPSNWSEILTTRLSPRSPTECRN